MASVNNDDKVEKKLTQTSKRIIKRRKREGGLNKELLQFEEIRNILQSADNSEGVLPSQRMQEPALEVNEIPLKSAGVNILQPTKAFALFTEDSLQLAKFDISNSSFFGRPLSALSDRLLRKFLKNLIYELRHTDNDDNRVVSLYVLYLLSVTSDLDLLESCRQFLLRFPCQLSAADILPIFANYGADIIELCGSDLQIVLPQYLTSSGKRRTDFPFSNIQRICSILSFFADQHRIVCDQSTKPLVVALVKLSIDVRIRRSTLLSDVCGLLTRIAVLCEEAVGATTVASWFILPDELPLNLLDICRISLRPTSPVLHHTLLAHAINTTLKSKLKLKAPFQISDLKAVLNNCLRRKSSVSLLHLYTVFELLIASLPLVTAGSPNNLTNTSELPSVERLFVNKNESSDLVRLRASSTKLRSLITLKFGCRFGPVQEL